MPRRLTRCCLLFVACAALAPSTTRGGDDTAKPDATPAVPPADLCGRLGSQDGIPVLELWGTPEQAGFAHGWLMAEPIVSLFDDYILDPKIVRAPAIYEALLLPTMKRRLTWDKSHERELQAMCDGIVARLGRDRVRSEKLDRELTVADLMAANSLADWRGVGCSSFSVWGKLTADGQTITARNLDFPSTPAMARNQMVLVYRGDESRSGWVGVTWPGLIGAYTAMNADGVTILMHDAAGLPPTEDAGFTPRSLILREALESARGAKYLDTVQDVFAARRVMVGNNIHVSGPRSEVGRTDATAAPAAVFEYDGNEQQKGVTRREPDADTAGGETICCTNHMCDRANGPLSKRSSSWERFDTLATFALEQMKRGEAVNAESALAAIDRVNRRDTLHSVVCLPAQRRMLVRIPAVVDRLVEIRVDEWLNRR